MTPRPYQEEAARAVLAAWEAHRSAVVELPTGCGKTVLFSDLIRRHRPEKRAMVIAHRQELIDQAAATIEAVTGEAPAIEMADQRSDETNLWNPARVVVGSVQTLCRPERLAKFDPADFGQLIVDEAHHDVPQCATYRAIRTHFERNPDLRVLGVTATALRADKLALGQSYETVAYRLELPDAIDGGWLVPIRQRFVQVHGIDFSHVRTTAGDLNQGDLEQVLAGEPTVCHEVASAIADIAGGRKTLVFCVSVDHARITAQILNRIPGVTAAVLTGEDDRDTRRSVLSRYAAGHIQVLVGCAIFTEGFDEPSIEVVAVARPTTSRALYTQMVGRGTRTMKGVLTPEMNGQAADVRRAAVAASAKPFVEVIDLVGNSGRHKLVSTADILAGRHAPAAAVARAVDRARRQGGSVDMRAATAKAAAEIAEAERKRREAEEARRRELDRQRQAEQERAGLYGKAKYAAEDVDPFGFSGSVPGRVGGYGRDKLPTERMANLLRKAGIDPAGMTFAEASRKIGEIKAHWEGRGCSPKQKAVLEKYGERGQIGREKARVLFALLNARRWRPRDYRLTRDRLSIKPVDGGKFVPVVNDPIAGKVLVTDAAFGSVEDCRAFLGAVVEQGQAA